MLRDEHAWSDDEEERRRFRNGEDVRYLPLIDRKLRLRAVVPKRGERLLYCDHVEQHGEGSSGWSASTTSKASWQNGSSTRISLIRRVGGRFGTKAIANGSDARNYLNGSGRRAPISKSGADTLWRVPTFLSEMVAPCPFLIFSPSV